MNRTDVAYLVNSTPAYFYILPFHFEMLRRYAPDLKWKVILATEVPDHPVCTTVAAKYDVEIMTLDAGRAGFLDSRGAALESLVARYSYVFPVQEDFILERLIDGAEFEAVLREMDATPGLVSARSMPCPGPFTNALGYDGLPAWRRLDGSVDAMGFVFQATLWKTSALLLYYSAVCARLEYYAPKATTNPSDRTRIEVKENLAENAVGQGIFWKLSTDLQWTHIAYARRGRQPNGVYLSPFPYRPTAIVRGTLEPWATELARREGFVL